MTEPQQPQEPQAVQAAPVSLTPHRGTTVLVLGILGLVGCIPLGIAAWVMGNNDLREMLAGRMDRSGEGTTKVGKLCGMISVILTCCWVVLILILFLFGATSFLFGTIGAMSQV